MDAEVATLFNRAVELHRSGRIAEAKQLYLQALEIAPDDAKVNHSLALIASGEGRDRRAVELFELAIRAEPDNFILFSNYGNHLKSTGQSGRAAAAYKKALAINPADAESHYNLGLLYQEESEVDLAIGCYEKALAIKADLFHALNNLGLLHLEQERYDAAAKMFGRALAVNPRFKEACVNLGLALRMKGDFDGAAGAYEKAGEIDPKYVEATSNLAVVRQIQGRMDESLALHEKAVALGPDCADAHWNRALALLTVGDYRQGWREYEWRMKAKNDPSPKREFAVPAWKGEPLDGHTLFVHAEQGFGDTLQLIRYVPLLRDYEGKIVVEVPPALKRLVGTIEGVDVVVAKGEAIPPFDRHIPLMSLAGVFGTTLDTIPFPAADSSEGYVTPDPVLAASWGECFHAEGLKVGLCWSGNPKRQHDGNRSFAFERMRPLLGIEGVFFYSLQKGSAAEQAAGEAAENSNFFDFTDRFADFADTAALVAHLDLIISVDTAVIHLAGAMGKPAWLLQSKPADWRWMLDRDDSPWYPSVRIFRQRAIGDWDPVIAEVRDALAAMAASPPTSRSGFAPFPR